MSAAALIHGRSLPAKHNRRAVDLDLPPAAAKVDQAALFQLAAKAAGIHAEIVVAQDEVHARPGRELPQRIGNPIQARRLIDQIARDER